MLYVLQAETIGLCMQGKYLRKTYNIQVQQADGHPGLLFAHGVWTHMHTTIMEQFAVCSALYVPHRKHSPLGRSVMLIT